MIHPTALIDPRAQLDQTVEVGPWCTIGPHVTLGAGCVLKSHVVLKGHTDIGQSNTFFPFTVIGEVPQDLKYRGEPTRLVIGDRNTFRENVTINIGTAQGGGVTQIGSDCLLMGCVHVGHDSQLGNHCIVANNAALAGHVVLGDYVTLGGVTGVGQFTRIGAHAYIGGHSAVEKDVPPFSIAFGSRPCVLKGTNIVGLRRRGFSNDTIMRINEAIKLWGRPDVPKEQCLLEMESECLEVQGLIAFIRQSESGVVR